MISNEKYVQYLYSTKSYLCIKLKRSEVNVPATATATDII